MEDVKYIVELANGAYIKSGKYDTNKIEEAKRFKSLKYLKQFVDSYGVGAYKIIEDYGDGVYALYIKK